VADDVFTKADYEDLARFRYGLRLYFRFSERAVREFGLTPQQYQLMLAIKGFQEGLGNRHELAERLQSSHNSVVGLIDRSVANGLIERKDHPTDRRAVAVHLTATGDKLLQASLPCTEASYAGWRKLIGVHAPSELTLVRGRE